MNSGFKDSKTVYSDSENSKTPCSGSVIIKTVHFIGTCLKAVGTKDCFSPALSECGVMSQQTVSPQASARLPAQPPVQLSDLPGVSIPVLHQLLLDVQVKHSNQWPQYHCLPQLEVQETSSQHVSSAWWPWTLVLLFRSPTDLVAFGFWPWHPGLMSSWTSLVLLVFWRHWIQLKATGRFPCLVSLREKAPTPQRPSPGAASCTIFSKSSYLPPQSVFMC